MEEVMITTMDNPYDPFENFTQWLLYDKEKGYDTCERLARLVKTREDMTQKEINMEIERAIDEIIEFDPLGLYKKIKKKS